MTLLRRRPAWVARECSTSAIAMPMAAPRRCTMPPAVKVGEGRVLTGEQERGVQQLIRVKTPHKINLPNALWSRGAVAELIADRFGIRIPLRTMGTYLFPLQVFEQQQCERQLPLNRLALNGRSGRGLNRRQVQHC